MLLALLVLAVTAVPSKPTTVSFSFREYNEAQKIYWVAPVYQPLFGFQQMAGPAPEPYKILRCEIENIVKRVTYNGETIDSQMIYYNCEGGRKFRLATFQF
jgi:hypothetical protein